MRLVHRLAARLAYAAIIICGLSAPGAYAQAPPMPSLTSLSPNTATAGGAGFTITVNGSNFIFNSVVQWNGVDRPTVFVSGTQLTAMIPALLGSARRMRRGQATAKLASKFARLMKSFPPVICQFQK